MKILENKDIEIKIPIQVQLYNKVCTISKQIITPVRGQIFDVLWKYLVPFRDQVYNKIYENIKK